MISNERRGNELTDDELMGKIVAYRFWTEVFLKKSIAKLETGEAPETMSILTEIDEIEGRVARFADSIDARASIDKMDKEIIFKYLEKTLLYVTLALGQIDSKVETDGETKEALDRLWSEFWPLLRRIAPEKHPDQWSLIHRLVVEARYFLNKWFNWSVSTEGVRV